MARHQTLHKEIKLQVLKLRSHASVKRVAIGPYENCRHRYTPGTIQIQMETQSGFKLNGYDGSGVYCFYLYLESEAERDHVRNHLKYFYPARGSKSNKAKRAEG